MEKETCKIDFVVPWVDSSDPAWIEQYNHYRPEKPITDRGRFRNGFHTRGSSSRPPVCIKSVILPPVLRSFKYIAIA